MIIVGTEIFGAAKYLNEIFFDQKNVFWAYSYRIKSFYAHQKIEPVKNGKNQKYKTCCYWHMSSRRS